MTSLATNGTLTSVVWHPCRHALQKSGHAASASLIFIGVCDKMRLCGTMTITVCLSFLPQRCLTRSSFRQPIDVSRHPRRDATTRTRRRVVCRLVSHTLATLARALHVDLLNCQLLVVAHTHPIFLDTTQSGVWCEWFEWCEWGEWSGSAEYVDTVSGLSGVNGVSGVSGVSGPVLLSA